MKRTDVSKRVALHWTVPFYAVKVVDEVELRVQIEALHRRRVESATRLLAKACNIGAIYRDGQEVWLRAVQKNPDHASVLIQGAIRNAQSQ